MVSKKQAFRTSLLGALGITFVYGLSQYFISNSMVLGTIVFASVFVWAYAGMRLG